MRLADLSVQKLTRLAYPCRCGKTHGKESELFYADLKKMGEILKERFPSFKILLVVDKPDGANAAKYLPSDAMTILLRDGDVTQLFAFPENISLVVAFGSSQTIKNARYFACVRKLPIAVLPTEADAEALWSRTVRVSLFGQKEEYPVPTPDLILFDERKIERDSLKDVYLSLVARSLCTLEEKFSHQVLEEKEVCGELYELAYDVYLHLGEIAKDPSPVTALFEQSLRMAYAYREGGFLCESRFLFSRLRNDERLDAYVKLVGVYDAFFRFGGRRKYRSPDHGARFHAAALLENTSEFTISERCPIPTKERLRRYEENFERTKKRFALRTEDLKKRSQTIKDGYVAFGGVLSTAAVTSQILTLPERTKKYGILSLMRDFGLLEK